MYVKMLYKFIFKLKDHMDKNRFKKIIKKFIQLLTLQNMNNNLNSILNYYLLMEFLLFIALNAKYSKTELVFMNETDNLLKACIYLSNHCK